MARWQGNENTNRISTPPWTSHVIVQSNNADTKIMKLQRRNKWVVFASASGSKNACSPCVAWLVTVDARRQLWRSHSIQSISSGRWLHVVSALGLFETHISSPVSLTSWSLSSASSFPPHCHLPHWSSSAWDVSNTVVGMLTVSQQLETINDSRWMLVSLKWGGGRWQKSHQQHTKAVL